MTIEIDGTEYVADGVEDIPATHVTQDETNDVADLTSSDVTSNETDELTDEPDKPENVPVKSSKNYNKRIQQVIRQRKEAVAANENLLAEIAELRSKVTNSTKAEQNESIPLFDKVKPDMSNYDSIGQYTEELADWKFEQREFESTQKRLSEDNATRSATVEAAWNQREEAAKLEFEDYDAVVNLDSFSNFNITSESHAAARDFLANSEYGPAVLYELLQNDETAETFKNATSIQQVRTLVKIESKIESNIESSVPSNEAPPRGNEITIPPKFKGGVAIANKTTDEIMNSDDFSEYVKLRNQQKAARR